MRAFAGAYKGTNPLHPSCSAKATAAKTKRGLHLCGEQVPGDEGPRAVSELLEIRRLEELKVGCLFLLQRGRVWRHHHQKRQAPGVAACGHTDLDRVETIVCQHEATAEQKGAIGRGAVGDEGLLARAVRRCRHRHQLLPTLVKRVRAAGGEAIRVVEHVEARRQQPRRDSADPQLGGPRLYRGVGPPVVREVDGILRKNGRQPRLHLQRRPVGRHFLGEALGKLEPR
eukprot:scaffold2058_cov115-Isochrysis_galbana.AAC.2